MSMDSFWLDIDKITYRDDAIKQISKYRSKTRYYNRYYKHDTFKVTSVSQYLAIINAVKDCDSLVYRGMQNLDWKLEPSLCRNHHYIADIEHNMIEEFICSRPREFEGLSNSFDVVAKMQHYGLPTRLLDFTTNPLVALYFACEQAVNESINDCIGRVVCGKASFKKPWICNFLCDLHNHRCDRNFINILNESEILFEGYYYNTFDSTPIYAKPFNINQRIINQSGLFMVFPNNIEDVYASFAANGASRYGSNGILTYDAEIEENYNIIKDYENVLETHANEKFHKQRQLIGEVIQVFLTRKSAKKIIDLYIKGDICNAGVEEVDFNKFRKTLLSRLALDGSLHLLDNEVLEKKFFSVLIEPDAKKSILAELRRIGIDIAFIYPELEYTAKKIKARYWEY